MTSAPTHLFADVYLNGSKLKYEFQMSCFRLEFWDNFNAALQRFDEANKNFFKSLIVCVIACSLTKQPQKAQSWKKDLIETIIFVSFIDQFSSPFIVSDSLQ